MPKSKESWNFCQTFGYHPPSEAIPFTALAGAEELLT